MLQPPPQDDGLSFVTYRPRRVTERRLQDCADSERAHGGIVAVVEVSVMCVALLVVERQTSVDIRSGFEQQTAFPKCRPRGVMRLELDLVIIELARDPEQIGRNLVCPIKLTSSDVEIIQASEGCCEVGRALEPVPEADSPLCRFAGLRGRSCMNIYQGRQELYQDRQLGAPPVRPSGCASISDRARRKCAIASRLAALRAACSPARRQYGIASARRPAICR